MSAPPGEAPKVRELAASDLDALLALYLHLHESDEPLPARREVEKIWRALVDDPKSTTWGAELDGGLGAELVASCVATVVPNLTRGARSYGVIENVVTHADYRRRGLGRAVMQAALDRCWSAGCYKVMLLSGMQRREVHAFYERLGFDPDSKRAFLIRPSAEE